MSYFKIRVERIYSKDVLKLQILDQLPKQENMETKSKKNTKEPAEKDNFFYLDSSAKDYSFSDFVRVSSCPTGLIFYFGKWYPDKKQFGIYESILLPFNVAMSLQKIIVNHIDKLKKMGLLQVEETKA